MAAKVLFPMPEIPESLANTSPAELEALYRDWGERFGTFVERLAPPLAELRDQVGPVMTDVRSGLRGDL